MRIARNAIVLAFAAGSAAAQSPSDFAMRQPLATAGDNAFFRIELPDSVYDGATRADLGDLRVFNGDGAVVPFAFMPRPAPVSASTPQRTLALFPLTVDTTRPEAGDLSIKLRTDAAGTTVDIRSRDGAPVTGSRVVGYLVDTQADDKPLVALVLRLPESGNVNARVRIDASDDLDHWRTVVASAPLLSLEYNGRRLLRDRVEFPRERARYLRITWLTPSPPELASVLGDVGDRVVEPPRRTRRVPGVADPSMPDAFTFDLGAALPVDRVTLELPEINTVVPVSWEIRTNAQDPWRTVGSSVVYRLRQDAGEAVNPEFAISALHLRYVRARLDPKAGGVGTAPPTLAAGWYAQGIVFAARGAGPFELAYGSRRVGPGSLSVAMLVPGYMQGKPLPSNVGVATLAVPPSTANRAALREPLDVKRWLLWGSLVVASLLLGYMALRLAQQMRGAAAPARGSSATSEDAPPAGSPGERES
jgi:hypothetical protein